MPQLTPEQRRNIRKALRVAQKLGATPRERKALIEAMGVESNYRHLDYGDRDSVGVLQQRPSQGWGPAGETVEQDVRQFLVAARKANTQGGSAGQLAQRVQRSAFPERYDQLSGQAEQILGSYRGGGSTGPQRASQASYATTPGVDNSGLRRQMLGEFFQQGGVRNPGAVLSLAGSYGQAADVPGTTVRVPGQPMDAGPRDEMVPMGGSKNAGKGTFEISGPDPGRLQPELKSFARKVANIYGGELVGLDGSTHSKYTVNGNVSEHFTGNATDIFTINGKPATGARLIRAGRAALIAAGMPREEALRAPGGLYNVGDHQIIFGVDGAENGGDHTDHLHISARRGADRGHSHSHSGSVSSGSRTQAVSRPEPRARVVPAPAAPVRPQPVARQPKPVVKERLYANPREGLPGAREQTRATGQRLAPRRRVRKPKGRYGAVGRGADTT